MSCSVMIFDEILFDTMAYRRYEDAISLQHAIRRRERFQYGDRKLSSYGNSNVYLPLQNSLYPNIVPDPNTPYLDERFRYPRLSQLRENESVFNSHPYHKPERFPPPKGMGIIPPRLQYPNRSFNFQRNRFSKEDPSFSKKFYKGFSKRQNRKTPKARTPPVKAYPLEQSSKPEENVAELESSVVNYCLDEHTQYTISRLQSDFRLTRKYKTFVMYEMPIISDFKPTPATTTNKFNDRFKCLSQQLLDLNDLNVDHDLEMEKETEKPDVLENVTTKVTE